MTTATVATGTASAGERTRAAELARRTIRRSDYVSCARAFIDCRTPGSELKENYSIVGPGVSQSADQVVNLREAHGFNIGAAAMPHGITNNLHMHFTAEVFLNVRGDWRVRWGVGGRDGELVSHEGDIISVPTWIFRGFTNEGVDDGWLFTVLGRDDTGGIVWDPAILESAAAQGLFLTADGRLVDTAAGERAPDGVELVTPMSDADLRAMTHWDVAAMSRRVVPDDSLVWSDAPYLCSGLPGGDAQLAPVIGFGTTEDRACTPPLVDPHGFTLERLRAAPGDGVLAHRHEGTSVLIVQRGRWRVTVGDGTDSASTDVGPWDTVSLAPLEWRSLTAIGDDEGHAVLVTGGDSRTRLAWHPDVVHAARAGGRVIDPDGYVGPLSVVRMSTIDD